jgi:hypothetical protein
MATLEDWNYKRSSVNDLNPADYVGRFIEGETVVIAAGPATYHPNTINDASQFSVIGLTQSISISSGQQVQRVFELGSRKGFLVAGRGAGSIQIAKVWMNSDSLAGALYRATDVEEGTYYREAGYNYKYTNLQSELFHTPLGLLVVIHDQNDEMVSASFYEVCYIASRQWAVSARGLVVAENVSIQYEEEYPVDPGDITWDEE